MRLRTRLMAATGIVLGAGCAHATQTYPLELRPTAAVAPLGMPSADGAPAGSLSVERIEGGQHLLTLQLHALPPPELFAPGAHAFVVWLQDPRGAAIKVGTLHYDRTHHSGNLLATTELTAFTVRVTGERDGLTSEPSGVLLAERRVVPN